MTYALVFALFALLAAALAARLLAARAGREAGLPRGRLVYSDTGHAVGKLSPVTTDEQGARQERPLVSRRHALTGRPDYLIRTRDGLIPVEAKSTMRPPGARPYDSHVLQLAAYCLLVEDQFGAPVPYGLIRYRDSEARVEFTPALREELLALLEEVRAAGAAEDVHRSHEEPRRCARCAVRDFCDERLD